MNTRVTAPRTKRGLSGKIGWGIVTALSLLLVVLAGRYLSFDPDVFFPDQKAVYLAHTAAIMTHIVSAMIVVLIGPFQFLPALRRGRWLKLHRWLGRTYLIGVAVSGLSGLYMARLAHGGWIAQLGFGVLALLWLCSGWMAYASIRKKQVDAHRAWMIRNYALTFGAVTLRLWQPIFGMLGLDFDTGYRIVAWLAWAPNLIVAEMLIRGAAARRTGEYAELGG
jgi:uncharacterized membrane protein